MKLINDSRKLFVMNPMLSSSAYEELKQLKHEVDK